MRISGSSGIPDGSWGNVEGPGKIDKNSDLLKKFPPTDEMIKQKAEIKRLRDAMNGLIGEKTYSAQQWDDMTRELAIAMGKLRAEVDRVGGESHEGYGYIDDALNELKPILEHLQHSHATREDRAQIYNDLNHCYITKFDYEK